MNKFKIVWSARSECGPNREKNEDSIHPTKSGSANPHLKLLSVMDLVVI